MRHIGFAAVGLCLAGLTLGVVAGAEQASAPAATQSAPAEGEVTLQGMLLWEVSAVANPKGVGEDLVLFALDGPPEVAAALETILKDHYPADGLDGAAARRVQQEFERRLKYYIAPGEASARFAKGCRWRAAQVAVTGALWQRDGRKWLTPSRVEPVRLKWPDRMLAPDKPLAMPAPEPLVLKVNDTLSVKCVLLPRGQFLAGLPFYFHVRYDDDFPALLTLTRPFYLAEAPVTQEVFEAVMGHNPSEQKGPQVPVHNVSCADMRKFCRLLSEKTGRTVCLPTQAQWEYAARVGTSNPPFPSKYKDQLVRWGPQKTLPPVKGRSPNAWGLYDMLSPIWEMTGDQRQFSRQDAVDPRYPTPCESGEPPFRKHGHNAMGAMGGGVDDWSLTTREGVGDGGGKGYGLTKFRVAVEATDDEAAAMDKAAKPQGDGGHGQSEAQGRR